MTSKSYTIVCTEAEWQANTRLRGDSWGASEVGSLLGVNKYTCERGETRADLIRAKAEYREFEGNEHTEYGTRVEDVMAQWARERRGIEPDRFWRWQLMLRSISCPWLTATPDYCLSEDGEERPADVKDTHSFYSGNGDAAVILPPVLWRGGVPPYVEVQVQVQLLVTGASVGYVIHSYRPRGPEWITVRRDDYLINKVIIPETLSAWREVIKIRKEAANAA